MGDVMLRRGDWVVVCDGAKALVFENEGALNAPKLKLRDASEQPNPPTHELGTDSPGRTMNSVDGRTSAVGQTDWHDEAERDFLAELTRRLDSAVAAGEVTSLVIVAPPRALGMLRSAYTPALRAAVRSEIDKDFVKLPVSDIEKRLAA